jgi:gamma-glutamyltranspeptidase/glutathione hydrolase
MALGGSMGTRIISSVFQVLLNRIEFGFDAERAVMAPRFHHQWQPDTLFLEPEFPRDVRSRLEALGHTLREATMIGAVQLSLYDPASCYFWGGADGRRDSAAAGANIGAIEAVTPEQRCALVNNRKATSIPQ